jgi:SAM-dependent MidA family methyltransferase
VRRHAPHDVLTDPGSADLTAHVDFDALARAVTRAGAASFGPVAQGEWLARLGIAERTARLAAAAPDHAAAIDSAFARLTAAPAMGTLFKAFAIGRAGDPAPPGFEPMARRDAGDGDGLRAS